MIYYIHCVLSSTQKWCLWLIENILLQSQLSLWSSAQIISWTLLYWHGGRYLTRKGGSTLTKEQTCFWWVTMIQVLPPIFCLHSRQPAETNGAFLSLPLSFSTHRSYWSGGSLNSNSKELLCPTATMVLTIQRDLPLSSPTNLTSLESFDRCLAYSLTRLKAGCRVELPLG